MKNISLLLGTIIGTLILIVGVAFFFSKSAPTAADTAAKPVDQELLVAGATKIKGKADAPITLVEFSDFQCPACKGYQPVVQQVLEKFPDSVRLVYHHFPLDQIHPNARLAAQASEVALEMGKFWEFHDLLFARQEEWGAITKKEDLIAKFSDYAAELKIDKKSFSAKIETLPVAEIVKKDADLGNTIGVQATPSFYVNGVQTAAPQLLETVSKLTEKK
ncbi:thioredoxin domain-containing protein [Candidatus Woesebacteria bacterium]|nr:thioredoxin domain-containing protein [Candidatus Woesebacteria bacterium]